MQRSKVLLDRIRAMNGDIVAFKIKSIRSSYTSKRLRGIKQVPCLHFFLFDRSCHFRYTDKTRRKEDEMLQMVIRKEFICIKFGFYYYAILSKHKISSLITSYLVSSFMNIKKLRNGRAIVDKQSTVPQHFYTFSMIP